MMKLTTLWALDRTIDPATGRSPIAEAIAAHWDHDPDSVRFFRTSANAIYRLNRSERAAYLRIAPDSERSRHHIERELDLLAWLTAQDVPVVQSIPARSGDLVVTVDASLGPMHAVLSDALNGRHLDLDDLTTDDARVWGMAVGRLHAALATSPDQFRGRPAAWRDAIDRAERDDMPFAIRAEAARLRAVLDGVPRDRETYGPIHTDLELDNLVWNDRDVAILDFDEFGDGWYMLDIAKALTDLLRDGETIGSPRISGFVSGYRNYFPLDDAMLCHLSDFLALSDLRGYISLVRAIDISPDDAEIDWLYNLIVRLRAWMDWYEVGLQQ